MSDLFLAQGGVEEDLKEIIDEERDKIEPLDDSTSGGKDLEDRCLQAAYQLYLESVVDEDEEK